MYPQFIIGPKIRQILEFVILFYVITIKIHIVIMLTCPCNENPLKPHFCLNFALKHILWVLV